MTSGGEGEEERRERSLYNITPLFMASRKGHVDVVKTLIADQRINPNQASNFGTPLLIASHHGLVDVVETLLADQRINVNAGKIQKSQVTMGQWGGKNPPF